MYSQVATIDRHAQISNRQRLIRVKKSIWIEKGEGSMMKVFLQVSVVFVLALIGLGSAIRCYSCIDYTGSCTVSVGCGAQYDGCLTLNERNGKIYRQCIKYSDCKSNILGTLFPQVASMSFSCCSDDLCNGASVTAARTSVLGLLLSLALFWWCIF